MNKRVVYRTGEEKRLRELEKRIATLIAKQEKLEVRVLAIEQSVSK